MKIICLLVVCTTLLLSCGQPDNNIHTSVLDSNQTHVLSARGFNSDIIQKLQEWREDSLGCLGFRDRFMKDNTWMEKLQLSKSSKAQILDMLGKPNELVEYPPTSTEESGEIHFNYYTKSGCIAMNERIEPRGVEEQLHIIFDYKTEKAKKVLGSLH